MKNVPQSTNQQDRSELQPIHIQNKIVVKVVWRMLYMVNSNALVSIMKETINGECQIKEKCL